MKSVLFAVTLAFLCSCSTQTFKVTQGSAKTVPNYEGTNHFIFWGLGQEKLIDPKEVCGERKVAQIHSKTSFMNGLLGGITWGIYAPRDYAIYCE